MLRGRTWRFSAQEAVCAWAVRTNTVPGTDIMVTAGGPKVSEGEGCAVKCWPHFCDQSMKTSWRRSYFRREN